MIEKGMNVNKRTIIQVLSKTTTIMEVIILTILLVQVFMTIHIIVGDLMIVMLGVDEVENLSIVTIDTTIVARVTIEDMMDTTVMMIIIIAVEVTEEKNCGRIAPEVEVMNLAVDRDEDIDTNTQIGMITARGQDLNLRKTI